MRRRRHSHTCVRPRGSRPHKGPWITPELSSRQGRSADPSCAQIEHPFANLLVASARLESGHEAVVVEVRLYSAGRRAGSVPAVLRFAHFRVGLLWLVPSLLACFCSRFITTFLQSPVLLPENVRHAHFLRRLWPGLPPSDNGCKPAAVDLACLKIRVKMKL